MQWRIVGVFVVMLLAASSLMIRLYALSMNLGLEQAAQSQSAYTLKITTTRGQIYDRNLQPLTVKTLLCRLFVPLSPIKQVLWFRQ